MFLETISKYRGITFSFGLLEHYWRFQDLDIRPNHPCIEVSKWKQIFWDAGYKFAFGLEAYFKTFGVIYGELPSTSTTNVDQKVIAETISNIKDNRPQRIVFSTQEVAVRNVCNKLRQCNNKVTLILQESRFDQDCLSKRVDKVGCDFWK